MELSFANPELREICEKREAAVAAIGPAAALELAQRLADIIEFDSVADFAVLFPGDVLDRSIEERSLRLNAGVELVFRSGHVQTPTTSTKAVDWGKVTRIRIVAIESTDE